jgi:hypothetical protein
MPGYTGDNCQKCQKLYFGEPGKANGSCQFCECNGNIDANDPEGCDSTTGKIIFYMSNHMNQLIKIWFYFIPSNSFFSFLFKLISPFIKLKISLHY